jgi:glycosyltransferase involved in cell wall biosynthesis
MSAAMAGRPLTVLILAQVFHPSIEVGGKRVTALARYLVAEGARVLVVSEFDGASIVEDAEVLPGVIAIPVPRPPRLLLDTVVSVKRRLRGTTKVAEAEASREDTADHASMGPRPLSARVKDAILGLSYAHDRYKRWSWRASKAAVRAGRRYGADVVICSAPPHSPLVGARLAAWRLGVPFIGDLRDPWSDINPPTTVQLGRTRASRLRRFLERVTLGSAAAITCTAEPYRQVLASRYARRRVLLIRNGFDGNIRPARVDTGGRLDILFAGEIYMERDPFPLLEAFDRLVSRPDVDASRVTLTMAGRCESYRGQSLREWLNDKRAAGAVRILGQQPPARVAELIEASTVVLNLAQRQLLAVTAKTYEHLASGREMLVICEAGSGTGRLVAGITGVNVVDPGDAAGLDAVLLDLYRRHVQMGRLNTPRQDEVMPYGRTASNEQFLSLIQTVTSAKRVAAADAATSRRCRPEGSTPSGQHSTQVQS